MAQFYLFCELYLLLWSAVLLSYRYGSSFIILINIRSLFEQSRRNRKISIIAGVIIALGLCFLPIDPGPAFLGDLIPTLTIVALLIWQVFKPVDQIDGYSTDKNGCVTGGWFCLIVAVIHLLFPSIVLL
ncbi:MAG: hypothetical protein K5634_05905 [Sphaerochaetaceae bacterium]|nr:hypothetical protein [Sphaerochaetaceae bacterium]